MTQNQLIDWRGLCEELVDIATAHANPDAEAVGYVAAALTRARLALAQPEPEVVGPTDEELLELWHGSDWYDEGATLREFRSIARAVLARWGRPAPAPAGEVGELVRQLGSMAADAEAADWVCDAAVLDLAIKHLEKLNPSQPVPPAEGEVADLAEFLRIYGDHVLDEYGDLGEHDQLTRAADLLERQAAPVPVAVSERLPGVEDCDAEGRCWVHQPHEACPESPAWELMSAKYASANYGAVCWLPAHALPCPISSTED